jgi:hypothetical protein
VAAGLAEFTGVAEVGADVFGEEEFVDPEKLFDGDAPGPAVFVNDPADEFASPAAPDPGFEFEFEFGAEVAAVFALPFLLAAADEFVLPGLAFEFELPDDSDVLSRAVEEFLLPDDG